MDTDHKYAWFIRHRPSCLYLKADLGAQVEVAAVVSLKDATPFDRHAEARDVLGWLINDGQRPDYEILDYAIRPEPIPDADQTPVPSLTEVMSKVYAAQEERRRQRLDGSKEGVVTDAPPVGEQQLMLQRQAQQGYGRGGFASSNAPLFPPRRAPAPTL